MCDGGTFLLVPFDLDLDKVITDGHPRGHHGLGDTVKDSDGGGAERFGRRAAFQELPPCPLESVPGHVRHGDEAHLDLLARVLFQLHEEVLQRGHGADVAKVDLGKVQDHHPDGRQGLSVGAGLFPETLDAFLALDGPHAVGLLAVRAAVFGGVVGLNIVDDLGLEPERVGEEERLVEAEDARV